MKSKSPHPERSFLRYAIFAILVAVPTGLITWIISKGVYGQPPDNGAVVAQVEGGGTTAAAPARKDDPDAKLRALFAAPLGGAKIQGSLELYDAEGLFEYINGAAPIFIERSFRKLAAAEMATDDGGELTCDVYDMSAAENAKSIYTKEQSGNTSALDIGDGGRSSAMSLIFRQDRYYVKLTAFDGKGEEALPKVAQALSEAMQ